MTAHPKVPSPNAQAANASTKLDQLNRAYKIMGRMLNDLAENGLCDPEALNQQDALLHEQQSVLNEIAEYPAPSLDVIVEKFAIWMEDFESLGSGLLPPASVALISSVFTDLQARYQRH